MADSSKVDRRIEELCMLKLVGYNPRKEIKLGVGK